MRKIRERLGRKRDTRSTLVGEGATRAADWGGRWVRRSPREGRWGSREVLWRALKTFLFFLLEVNLSLVQCDIDVFSLGLFCEAVSGYLMMLLLSCFKALTFEKK